MSEILNVDELRVGRHIKLSSKLGKIDVHCSDSTLGVWLANGKQSACVYMDDRIGPAFCVYPNNKLLPFSINTRGVQLPQIRDKNEPVRIMSWEEIANVFDWCKAR